ncbi:hypothetical protein NLG97_g9638 [Lecanicillium saksenae]|uniref:Uncharacterized protein n=1 Tax=Lecanicillium saksenae TaxID=468837 RepID=A0ACC1QHY1_9HYPO|nr:hypothetical protein NLG97_g9638 [Lecanicillium saksenae]
MRFSILLPSAVAAFIAPTMADYEECPDHYAPVTQFYLYANEECAKQGPPKQLGNVRVCMTDLAQHNYGEPEGCHKLEQEGVLSIAQWTNIEGCNLWLYTDAECLTGVKQGAEMGGCDSPGGDWSGKPWKAY